MGLSPAFLEVLRFNLMNSDSFFVSEDSILGICFVLFCFWFGVFFVCLLLVLGVFVETSAEYLGLESLEVKVALSKMKWL